MALVAFALIADSSTSSSTSAVTSTDDESPCRAHAGRHEGHAGELHVERLELSCLWAHCEEVKSAHPVSPARPSRRVDASMKRTAVTLMLMLAAVASAAVDVRAGACEGEGQKTQWAPTRNFSTLNARVAFASESRAAASPYAGERLATAAGAGIFLSRDPMGVFGRLQQPNELNAYAYASMNPMRYVDPDGRCSMRPGEDIAACSKREILETRRFEANPERAQRFPVNAQAGDEESLDAVEWLRASAGKLLPKNLTQSEKAVIETKDGVKQVSIALVNVGLGVIGAGPVTRLGTKAVGKVGVEAGTAAALDVAFNAVDGYLAGAAIEAGDQYVDGRFEPQKIHEAGVEGATWSAFGAVVGNLIPKPKAASSLGQVPKQPNQYSNAFEAVLEPGVWGRSDDVHFNRANAQLDRAMAADPAYRAMMEQMIPGVSDAVSSVGGRSTPKGWTWQHATLDQGAFWYAGERVERGGVLHLVPTEATAAFPAGAQHVPGSPWWRVLHPLPGAAGGYSQWARPAGAPKRD